MQRILKKLQQIDSHSQSHGHSNHSTTTTSTINHLDNAKLGHESHYCSKHTNDYREQLWCEFAFKTFILATKFVKNNIYYLSNHADIGVLNI